MMHDFEFCIGVLLRVYFDVRRLESSRRTPRFHRAWSRATLHILILSNGIEFAKRANHYEHQPEREDIVEMSTSYLDWMHKYRGEGYVIFCQDDSSKII